MSATSRNMIKIAKLLLNAGADVDIVGANGNTALTIAIITGNRDFVRLLIEKGANTNYVNEDGRSVRDIAKNVPGMSEILDAN